MRRKEFLDNLNELDMSQKKFSEFAGCSYQAVKQWKDHNIPNWVERVLHLIKILQDNASIANKYGLR